MAIVGSGILLSMTIAPPTLGPVTKPTVTLGASSFQSVNESRWLCLDFWRNERCVADQFVISIVQRADRSAPRSVTRAKTSLPTPTSVPAHKTTHMCSHDHYSHPRCRTRGWAVGLDRGFPHRTTVGEVHPRSWALGMLFEGTAQFQRKKSNTAGLPPESACSK